MKSLKMFTLFLILIFGGFGIYLFQFSDTAVDSTGATKVVEFDLLKGMRPHEISNHLERLGLIRNATVFFWLGKLNQSWNGIKAADYELNPAMTPDEIFKLFKSGIGIQRSLLVHEGDNIFQVIQAVEVSELAGKEDVKNLLSSREFIAELGLGNEGIRSLEGYLFPNTYFYDRKESPANLVKRMVDAFLRKWTPEFQTRAQELGLTRKQVLVLASMVEKETGASFERPIIASVFYNRLKKKMRLQSDPTTIYGMWSRYTGKIHRSDLLTPSEYNTYTIPALPVGPIANPNPESIKAVLYPADTDFLYFVSNNDGTHVFSKTYGEHNNWVKKTQLDPKAREGKSWRDLGKKKPKDKESAQ